MTRKLPIAGVALASALAMAACGGDKDGGDAADGSASSAAESPVTAQSSNAEIVDAYLSEINDIAAAVEQVDDEQSAEAAARVIRDASDRLEAMNAEIGADMSSARAMAVFGPHQQELIQAQSRLAMSMSRLAINHPELMQSIQDEMSELEMVGQP